MKKNLLFIRFLLLALFLFMGARFSSAQFIPLTGEEASCTSIMVGKKATTDGSVITSHSCDGNYRTWLNIVPHMKYDPGTTRKVLWGTMHTETSWDLRNIVVKGEIPQVEETYSYFNVCYPAMNEKQLAIGETTIGGRRELMNDDGMFVIEQLQAIALERCTNARDAIKLMGSLAMEYGYGDAGECLTVADKNEVWHFEIFGSSFAYEKPMAVWAAVRIPDDHVGVSANISRISTLKLDNPDYYMASENVFSLAEDLGYWDPDSGEPFKFWKVYSGRPTAFSIREFFILSTMAPSLNLKQDVDELPFSVKPDKKVSVRDVMAYYRQTYEGTEFDMTKDLKVRPMGRRGAPAEGQSELVTSPEANPFMGYDVRNLLNTLKPGVVESQRTIAISGCSYSQIIQCRDWLPDEIGGIAWFSFDNPGASPRIPVYSGTLFLPESFEICAQKRFRTDAAAWQFRRTNRLAEVRWGYTREYIEKAVKEFEDKAFAEIPMIDKMAVELYNKENGKEMGVDDGGNPIYPEYREFLTKYTNDFARATMSKWWEMGDTFWTMFARGF
ncbi:MAG TPA: C69 family dipeptidase [Bacteroidales bacterium]|nr:C69 family dipeptidase [Bacteroidales bacterium]